MLRSLLSVSLFLSSALSAQVLPPAISPARPVSQPVFGFPEGHQDSVHIAAGPTVTLVVWADERDTRSAIFAARIDGEGRLLDPLGLRIAEAATPRGVVWNGEDFLIVGRGGDGAVSVLVRVDEQGGILERRQERIGQFGDIASAGMNAKVLFLGPEGGIFDGRGQRLTGAVSLSAPPAGHHRAALAAASRGSEFLVLQSFVDQTRLGQCPVTCWTVVADRIDSNGTLLSTVVTGLDQPLSDGDSIDGGKDHYLLVALDEDDGSVHAQLLDPAGKWDGQKRELFPPGDPDRNRVSSVHFDGEAFIAGWFVNINPGNWQAYRSRISNNGTLLHQEQFAAAVGLPWEVDVAPGAGDQIVSVLGAVALGSTTEMDLTVHLTNATGNRRSIPLTSSGAEQDSVAVAATADGFMVAWREYRPGTEQYFVRAFNLKGQPLSAPIEIDRDVCCGNSAVAPPFGVRLASNGAVVLVVSGTFGGLKARRYSIEDGWTDESWLDVGSHLISSFDVASNGRDFAVVWLAEVVATSPRDTSLFSRSIPGAGTPGSLNELPVPLLSERPAIGSDGDGYLVVWTEGQTVCPILCPPPPLSIQAVRLSADARAVDTTPIILDSSGGQSYLPDVAWDGRSYVVIWRNIFQVRGVRVSSDGLVSERSADGGGTVLLSGAMPYEARFAKTSSRALLLTRAVESEWELQNTRTWEARTIAATTELSRVGAGPVQTLLAAAGVEQLDHDLAVASDGTNLVVAFVNLSGPEAGFVPRVFTRLHAAPSRRHAANR